MYSTCLFCNESLGRNEAIEHFPIGRRLAFDADKGRLWVVCAGCQRWNLTPVEERWEAMEECERLFRAQRLRAQTDHIGLAKVKEGTELVRIGRALLPEFAAWRYGRTFAARFRRRGLMVGGGTAVAGAGAVLIGAPLAAAAVAFPAILFVGFHLLVIPMMVGRGRFVSTKVVGSDGKVLRVTRADLDRTHLDPSDGDPWQLSLRHSYGQQALTGEVARRALGALLARVNRGGAPGRTVGDATTIVSEAGSPEEVARMVSQEASRRRGDFDERWKAWQRGDFLKAPLRRAASEPMWTKEYNFNEAVMTLNTQPSNPGAIPRLPSAQRLALEMALHESSEQKALEGDLAPLEAAWREAEEIAAIADNLLTPKGTVEFMERHKRSS